MREYGFRSFVVRLSALESLLPCRRRHSVVAFQLFRRPRIAAASATTTMAACNDATSAQVTRIFASSLGLGPPSVGGSSAGTGDRRGWAREGGYAGTFSSDETHACRRRISLECCVHLDHPQ